MMAAKSDVQKQVRRVTLQRRATRAFYCYRVLSRAYFHVPVLLIWLLEVHRFTVPLAELVLAIYGLALTYAAGLASRLQSRWPVAASIVLGELLKAAGLVALVLSRGSIAAVATGQVLNGLGYGLAQGPDSVVLRSLYNDDETRTYAAHESRSMSWVFVAVLVAGVIGGIMYSLNPSWPFWASVCTSLLAALAALSFGSASSTQAAHASNDSVSTRNFTLSATERQWMTYYVTMRSLALATFVGFLPIIFFYQLRIDIRLFGVVLGMLSVCAYLSGRFGIRLLRRVPDGLIPPVSIAGLAMSLVLLGAAPNLVVALLGMAVLGAVNGAVRPLTMARINSVPGRAPEQRSVIIGRMERNYGAANAIILGLGGLVAFRYGAGMTLWTFAIAALCIGFGGVVASARSVRRLAVG